MEINYRQVCNYEEDIYFISRSLGIAFRLHEPEYVLPTADRQGLSSLTAIFTSGPFVDQEMAKLSISEDETSDRYVIQVPGTIPRHRTTRLHNT